MNFLKDLIILSKWNICFPVALSTFAGAILVPIGFKSIITSTIGVFMLASASAVLNQIQEINSDKKMKRTINRPLVKKRISISCAVAIFYIYLLTGIFFLSQGAQIGLFLGIITLFLYNGIYTTLKKKNHYIVLIGAIVGALPPIIGFTNVGGSIENKTIWFLSTLFFLGQIPHFFLLSIKYKNQYQAANIKTITDLVSTKQIQLLTYIWTFFSCIVILLLIRIDIISNLICQYTLIVFIGLLVISIIKKTLMNDSSRLFHLFHKINFLYLIVILSIIYSNIIL